MLKPSHIVLAVLLGSLAAHSATGKQIRLLDGRLSFTAPLDLTPSTRPAKHSERYAALLDLASADRSFSLLVTYGRHSFEAPDVAELMREKVAEPRYRTGGPNGSWSLISRFDSALFVHSITSTFITG